MIIKKSQHSCRYKTQAFIWLCCWCSVVLLMEALSLPLPVKLLILGVGFVSVWPRILGAADQADVEVDDET